MQAGLQEVSQTGTIAVADIVTAEVGSIVRTKDHQRRPHWVPLSEVVGLADPRCASGLKRSEAWITSDASAGVSPHAAYSTSIEAIRRCVIMAKQTRRVLAMHVAECPDERTLLSNGDGPFAETLRDLGIAPEEHFPLPADWRNDYRPLLSCLSEAPRALIVHGNDLTDGEIAHLAELQRCSVVYCPRTHHYFGHSEHPVDRLWRAGVRVALGTDSRASNPDLNLWAEVSFTLQNRQDIQPETVLRMATADGADAMGLERIGSLTPGHRPGLVKWPSRSVESGGAVLDLVAVDGRVRTISS